MEQMSDLPVTDRLDNIKEAMWELEHLNATHPDEFAMWAHMLEPVETSIKNLNDAVTEQVQKA
jgi:hypothetical protein